LKASVKVWSKSLEKCRRSCAQKQLFFASPPTLENLVKNAMYFVRVLVVNILLFIVISFLFSVNICIEEINTESLKKAQHGKIENVAGSV
jgi:hypothetical protein